MLKEDTLQRNAATNSRLMHSLLQDSFTRKPASPTPAPTSARPAPKPFASFSPNPIGRANWLFAEIRKGLVRFQGFRGSCFPEVAGTAEIVKKMQESSNIGVFLREEETGATGRLGKKEKNCVLPVACFRRFPDSAFACSASRSEFLCPT